MDNSVTYIFNSKLATKNITLKFNPENLTQMKNYNYVFDVKILKKFIDFEKKVINFTSLPAQDSSIHNCLLFFCLLYTEFNNSQDFSLIVSSEDFLDNVKNKENLKIFQYFEYKDFRLFKQSLIEIGLIEDNTQDILNEIRNVVFDNPYNKIWILISPSKIFWTKCDKDCLNNNKHGLKLNNFSYIYFNHLYAELLMLKLAQHPRVCIAFMNSMNKANLEKCSKGLFKTERLEKLNNIKIYNFDQTYHKDIGKNEYVRNFESIMSKYNINETQVVFIESELDKNKSLTIKGDPYDKLAINFKVFDENYYFYNGEKQIEIDKEVENLSSYLIKLVENCTIDVREYLRNNPFIKV